MRALILTRLSILFSCLLSGPIFGESPPSLDLSLVAETEGLEPQGELILYAFVTNKSESELSQLSLKVLNGRFEVVGTNGLANSLGPFESTEAQIYLRIKKEPKVPFGKYQVPFGLIYHWKSLPLQAPSAAALEGSSVQRATVAVEVQPPFSAIANGLPGGTGPLFWLLFPLIPAFLAFQFVQRLRRRQGAQIPTFSANNVLPLFLIAVVINSLPFLSTTLANAGTLWLLVASAALGGIWPLVLWILDGMRWRRWGFRNNEKPKTFFRKALLSRWVPWPLEWITGTAGQAQWEGLLLRQPDGSLVLGSQIGVTPNSQEEKDRKRIEKLVNQANEGGRGSRWRLWFQLVTKQITVAGSQKPKLAGLARQQFAVTGPELEGLKMSAQERMPLLKYIQ
jgi:hypothetical protein